MVVFCVCIYLRNLHFPLALRVANEMCGHSECDTFRLVCVPVLFPLPRSSFPRLIVEYIHLDHLLMFCCWCYTWVAFGDYNDRWCVENNETHQTLVMYYNIFVHTIRLIIIVAAVGKDNAREEKSKSDATKPRFLYMPMKIEPCVH